MRIVTMGLFLLTTALPCWANNSLSMNSGDVQRFIGATQALSPHIKTLQNAVIALQAEDDHASEFAIEDVNRENFAETVKNSFSLERRVEGFNRFLSHLPPEERQLFNSAVSQYGYTSDETYSLHLAIATDVSMQLKASSLDKSNPMSAIALAFMSTMVSQDIPDSTITAFRPYQHQIDTLLKNTWYADTGTGE